MSLPFLGGRALYYPSRLAVFLLLALCCLPPLALATPAITPQRALLLMSEVSRSLDYQGVFTYEHGGLLRTVRIHHAQVADEPRERLLFLNGPPREIMHLGGQSCSDGMRLRGFDVRKPADVDSIERHYHLTLKGIDRVAGREVQLLYLEPRDELRYGYIFGLDRETGMLLQSMLIGEEGRVLERFQFADIQLGEKLDPALFEVGDSDQVTVLSGDCPSDQILVEQRWQTGWLPPGFRLSSVDSDPEVGREVMTFSDGLAVFSVFVDSERGVDLPELQAQRGATVAFLAKQTIDNTEYAICVVGEVPAQTAQRVALSLSLR